MSKKTKIINILPQLPFPKGTLNSPKPDSFPKSINISKKIESYRIKEHPFWIIPADDFPVRLAQSILNKTNKYDIECWSLYEEIGKEQTKKIKGIRRRFFPVTYNKIRIPGFGISYSDLISKLNNEINNNSVIIHLHGLHSRNMVPIYLWANLEKVPVVATQRGGVSPFFRMKNKPWLINHSVSEKLSFPKIDHFFAQSKFEYEYLKKNYGSAKVSHFMDGIDFSIINPIDKIEARKILGIPESKKVLLYVGHFSSNKPAKSLLSFYPKLKSEGIDLYFVGGYKTHNLYNKIVSTVPTTIDRISTKDLLLYYSAADIHVYPSSNETFLKFSSISNANMESLACNTPVYSSQLIHFLGDANEKELLGVDCGMVKDSDKFLEDIIRMFDSLDSYTECRKIAKKYYDRNKNSSKIIEIYDTLNDRYKLK